MRWSSALLIYRMLLPVLFVAAFPGWIVKMLRRGGFGTRLGERAAIYTGDSEFEPCGAVHVHAVSVGEALLGLRLIRAWMDREPDRRFVLATGTSTGHAVATAASLPGLRVTYSPLDFPSMVRRYLNRFEPARIVLIEGEAWPHLLLACTKRRIPVSLVNARMSPRSARRYSKAAAWLRPLFSMLDRVAVQESEDAAIWRDLGVHPDRIQPTGSLKFDPGSAPRPSIQPHFKQMLATFGKGRKVLLAASTHEGEHAWIANAMRKAAPQALPVIAPRHAERREEVRRELEAAGFQVILRSSFLTATPSPPAGDHVFVIDSTGELRDWTALADGVVIGKSFLTHGGQNPVEAILAGRPVVFGPHMENFEPLASRLQICGGAIRAHDSDALVLALQHILDPAAAAVMGSSASSLLSSHQGATERILDLLDVAKSPTN